MGEKEEEENDGKKTIKHTKGVCNPVPPAAGECWNEAWNHAGFSALEQALETVVFSPPPPQEVTQLSKLLVLRNASSDSSNPPEEDELVPELWDEWVKDMPAWPSSTVKLARERSVFRGVKKCGRCPLPSAMQLILSYPT